MKVINMNIFYFVVILLSFENSFAQKLNTSYRLFSDSKRRSEIIIFINDSTLIRKPYFNKSSFGCGLVNLSIQADSVVYKTYKYTKVNDTLIMFCFNNSKDVQYRLFENKYFENSVTKEVYVLSDLLGKKPLVAIKSKNSYFWVDTPKNTSRTKRRYYRKKRKELRKILKSKNSPTVKLYVGYDAFVNFGYQYVNGIIEVIEKKQ